MLVLCKTLLPTTETERTLIKNLNFEDSFQSLYAWMPVLHYQRVVAKPSHRKYQFTQLYPEDLNSYYFHLTAACCLPVHKILPITKKKKKGGGDDNRSYVLLYEWKAICFWFDPVFVSRFLKPNWKSEENKWTSWRDAHSKGRACVVGQRPTTLEK